MPSKGKKKGDKEKNIEIRAEKWLLKGLNYENMGEYENAIKCYKNALSGVENDKEAWNNIGLAYHQTGDFENADIALNKALELDPDYGIAWETKGYLYARVNMLDEAVEFFKKALSAGEKKADIWVTLGIIHTTQLRFEDAVDAFENALKINPNHVLALNNEGIAYQHLSQLREERESIEMLEKAMDYFERALSIDPNKAEVWNNYGVILGFLGRLKSSLSAFDKAILLAPNYGNAYFNKARVYLQFGDKKKAFTLLKVAIEKDKSLYEDAKEDLVLRKLKDTKEFQRLDPER